MKHSFLKKHVIASLLMIVSYSHGAITDDRNNYVSSECVVNECMDQCGCFNIQAYAGIVPVIWTPRGNFQFVSCLVATNSSCGTTPLTAVNNLFETPKFNKLFKLPWTVGGRIGYSLDDCTEIYIEGNYRQAKAKNFELSQSISNGAIPLATTFRFANMSKYNFYDFYVGIRWYFDPCWCSCVTPFFGLQVGLAHHKQVCSDINFFYTTAAGSINNPLNATGVPVFAKRTGFAGGGNFGFDYGVGCGFSLEFCVEVLATCAPTGNPNYIINTVVLPELLPTNLIFGGACTEIFFPITLGVRYDF